MPDKNHQICPGTDNLFVFLKKNTIMLKHMKEKNLSLFLNIIPENVGYIEPLHSMETTDVKVHYIDYLLNNYSNIHMHPNFFHMSG